MSSTNKVAGTYSSPEDMVIEYEKKLSSNI